jgi:putative intracellular protease/amidase
MGFLSTPALAAQLAETAALDTLDLDRYEAILVAGGQSPMFTFRDNPPLQEAIRTFYESERIVAVYCHGLAGLFKAFTLRDGRLITGQQQYSGRVLARAVITALGV